MWLSRACRASTFTAIALGISALSGCTFEPLAAQTTTAALSGSENASVRAALSRIEVAPAKSRVAQQVRNALLFSLNGGQKVEPGRHKLNLSTKSTTRNLSIETSAQAPTSSQVEVKVVYTLSDRETGATLATGTRSSIAAFDRTQQYFAVQRAERDAQNRAAKEVAQQIRLALAQDLAGA